MNIPDNISARAKEKENTRIIGEYKKLDYRIHANYEKLCAKYREANYAKETQLADALYSLMREAQKNKPKKDIEVILAERRATRSIAKTRKQIVAKPRKKQTKSPRKEDILNNYPEAVPHSFSFENSLAYFKVHRKYHKAFTAAEFAKFFRVDLVFANNVLNLATKMTILKAISNGKYYRAKRTKIDRAQLIKYKDLSENQVRERLDALIAKSGPIVYVPIQGPPKKKKHKTHIVASSHNNKDKTRHYENPSNQSYDLEIDGGSIDSMREVGHGRKKSLEYTKDTAIRNSRSRYGLYDKESILDYDLD